MATWSELIASPERELLVYATIQGVGDRSGLWRFSSTTGWPLSSGEGTWRPWLTALPDILSERVPFLTGGAKESGGSVTLSVLDYEDQVTDLLALDRGRSTRLSSIAVEAATVLSVDGLPTEFDDLTLTNGDILWIGSEAVEIVTRSTSPDVIEVIRARLGTFARTHITGTAIYVRPQLIQHRELRLYLAPINGSDAEAQLVGVYTVDSVALDDTSSAWVFRASSREAYLDRRCPRDPRRHIAGGLYVQETELGFGPPLEEGRLGGGTSAIVGPVGGELLVAAYVAGEIVHRASGRGHAGTKVEEWPEPGDELIRHLTVANEDFRATTVAGATTDRTSPNWLAVDSWVEVLLCILLSPALKGQAADNYNSSGTGWDGRNFSGLLAGYGVGVPWTEIDFESFEEVAADPAGLNFTIQHFALGDAKRTFAEVATELLKPSGSFLVRERGMIRLVAPKPLLQGDAPSTSVDNDVVLRKGNLPAIQVSRTESRSISEVRFTYSPREAVLAITWANRRDLFDPLDLYQFDGRALEIEAPGVAPSESEVLRELGLRHLRRGYRPYTRLDIEVDLEVWNWQLGKELAVNLGGIPNFLGGRSLVGVGLLEESEVRLDLAQGAFFAAKLLVAPAIRAGRISASADIESVSANAATVSANVYTSPDAPGDLPTSDAAAFQVGDAVRLVDATGADIGGTSQSVSSVSGNVVTLNGNFGGALAAGTTIVYANYTEISTRQSLRYVYLDRSWELG